jgi:uncharacterized membrane protein YGL010W
VPLIYFTIIGFLYCVRIYTTDGGIVLTLGHAAVAIVAVYYLMLSLPLAIGMILYSLLCLAACGWIQQVSDGQLGWICLGLFVTAWIFQFIGHGVEGKKPSFFKDLQFLMIGPAWVLSNIYRIVGLSIA